MGVPVKQEVNHKSPISPHRQLYAVLKWRILSNEILPEVPMPGERELAQMGATAAKILINRICGVPGDPRHVRLPVRLIRRKSCDALPVTM